MKKFAIVVVAVSAVLAGCSQSAAASATGMWSTAAPSGAYIELMEDGSLAGSDGCNRLMGSWEKDGADITFGTVGMTQMFCEGVDDWLSQMNTANLADDFTMTIFNEAGDNIGELKR